jgi:hypothetical protein
MEFDVVQTMLTLVISLVVSFHAVLYYPNIVQSYYAELSFDRCLETHNTFGYCLRVYST